MIPFLPPLKSTSTSTKTPCHLYYPKNRHTPSKCTRENELYYFNHRFYDPETKRFLSKDPAGMSASQLRERILHLQTLLKY
ncbi:hypothetical protein DID80_05610 [Candidatus Marinamargulisbacteria bacterium SCGC AAA071-K20]|nr:hypothetical protein DID80_05610 [Candidatus Marinamargulisbacteria bacterium SCGC AAA071-K20]